MDLAVGYGNRFQITMHCLDLVTYKVQSELSCSRT